MSVGPAGDHRFAFAGRGDVGGPRVITLPENPAGASGCTTSTSVSASIARPPSSPDFDQTLRQLAADHARRAGDQNVHGMRPCRC